ncbi:MAG: hypothetical protein K8R99_06300 [Actinomycetia bacterium]|nr:hypothetical protein [Actinomycetes bacterium]
MRRPISKPLLVGLPLVLLLGGGAVGWFTDIGKGVRQSNGHGAALPEVFDAIAPIDPLNDSPNPLDSDESMVIGANAFADAASAVEVSATARLEIPVFVGATTAAAVDPITLKPAPAPPAEPIVLGEATATGEAPAAPSPTQTGVVRELLDDGTAATQGPLRISTPFAAASGFAALCNEVEAANVPDADLNPAVRPTLAVLVNQPATMAISGTWADGTQLAKTTMVTLPAHDDEWQRSFAETGEQRSIIGCLTLPIDEVRAHAVDGVAQLRASVLAISATGQADLNATVTLNVAAASDDPFFVDQVMIAGRGEQRRPDGVLYPTTHVHYAFLSDAIVPSGSSLQPGQVRVLGEHAFVEGADCAGWAANQQGIDRTHSGRFEVSSEIRTVAGQERAVTVVDGDVYLDPTLPGGWEGSLCVRLQATDQDGQQRGTLALRGAQVRSPRTATYAVGVSADESIEVSWTSASGHGCAPITLLSGGGAQCAFSARWVPDGVVVRLTLAESSALIRVPVNTNYCNPDDSLEAGDGCNAGFTRAYPLQLGESVQVSLQVIRSAAPGVLWDDPSNAWAVGPVK